MSQVKQAEQLAEKVVQQLQNITDELTIKEITLNAWKELQKSIPNPNSLKRPRAAFRAVIESAFPSSNALKPGYYKTSFGKGKGERYEHLALWYCTSNEDRWEVTGDRARDEYWGKLPKFSSDEEQPVEQPAKQPTEQPKLRIEDMTLDQLELDAETQQIVNDALEHSGMSLADFIKQACKVYAKTVTGKAKQSEEDLSSVPTSALLIDPKYKTHPNRVEELVKRAIVAIMRSNDQAPEQDQRWMITQTSLQALTGSRPAAIKKLLDKYKTMIDDHNAKYDLQPYDNRKGNGRKIEDEIAMLTLVPDGLDI